MKSKFSIPVLLLLACSPEIRYVHIDDRVESATFCDTEFVSSSSSEGTSSSTDGSSSTGSGFECPPISDGTVQFCVDGYPCRNAYFDGVAEATGTGPAVIGVHGTYESIPSWLTYNPGSDLLTMALAQGGVMIAPIPDPSAQADGEPFPWWIVCGPSGTQCDRDDDFVLIEVASACVVEQGLASPNRVVVGGMSAGAILTSHVVERGLGSLMLAGATSWSGGTPAAYQPTVPDSLATSVFVLHGGPTDEYCGAGAPMGACYEFEPPSEQMAVDLEAAGAFSFVCDHGGGHNAQMGGQGAEFLSVARADVLHPWIGFPFGAGGSGSWPQMSGGTNWMLRNYGDCHNPGE